MLPTAMIRDSFQQMYQRARTGILLDASPSSYAVHQHPWKGENSDGGPAASVLDRTRYALCNVTDMGTLLLISDGDPNSMERLGARCRNL